jgi:hypothetical protein
MHIKTEFDLLSFSFVEKPILFKKLQCILITFIFYHRSVLKQDHDRAHFNELMKFRSFTHAFQDPPLCSSTV